MFVEQYPTLFIRTQVYVLSLVLSLKAGIVSMLLFRLPRSTQIVDPLEPSRARNTSTTA